MRIRNVVLLLVLTAAAFLLTAGSAPESKPASPDWSMNATLIEACSCPMFCQCYFNTEPAVHAGHEGLHQGHQEGHYCRFNIAYRINRGNYGATKLDGAKLWIAGDLGADFSQLNTDWAVVTFDPSVTKEQRDGIAAILGKIYPVKWKSFRVADDASVDWKASKDLDVAKLGGGKVGELELSRFAGMTNAPVVINNLRYFGAPRNDGFIMMPNRVEAYHAGDKPFEYHGTNGFMITLDINSSDVTPKAAKM